MKITTVLLGCILVLGCSKSAPKKDAILVTKKPINGEIGGIDYAYWNFGTPVFTKIAHTFTIYNEPKNEDRR